MIAKVGKVSELCILNTIHRFTIGGSCVETNWRYNAVRTGSAVGGGRTTSAFTIQSERTRYNWWKGSGLNRNFRSLLLQEGLSLGRSKKATACVSSRVTLLGVALSLHSRFDFSATGWWLTAVFPHRPSEEPHKCVLVKGKGQMEVGWCLRDACQVGRGGGDTAPRSRVS